MSLWRSAQFLPDYINCDMNINHKRLEIVCVSNRAFWCFKCSHLAYLNYLLICVLFDDFEVLRQLIVERSYAS